MKVEYQNKKLKIEEVAKKTRTKDLIHGWHGGNYKKPVKTGEFKIGIEVESKENSSKSLLELQALDICFCNENETEKYGLFNGYNAKWRATYDATVDVEFVSEPLTEQEAYEQLKLLYMFGDIGGDDETGNHYHINKSYLYDKDLFALLCIYLAPELKEASRRCFDSWNRWSTCRYVTLKNMNERANSWFNEMQYWDHPLIKISEDIPTIELRCFTTSSKIDIALKQLECLITLAKISNRIAICLDERVEFMFINGINLEFLNNYFDYEINQTNILELLEQIARD